PKSRRATQESAARRCRTIGDWNRRLPEQVNFNEPPAKFLKRILGRYKKTTTAMNLFPKLDAQVAINQCPYLKLLMEDLLRVAQMLQ
ncbi:MAG TPA: DUF4276 family protein, partial [Isosphaeraceae bacterium]|nr:DUF4276 family protein [Isosphaeraceae bacterium]